MAQGKGILQPHSLIDELENILGEDPATLDLKNGPFGQIIKSAKVTFTTFLFVQQFIFLLLLRQLSNYFINKVYSKLFDVN